MRVLGLDLSLGTIGWAVLDWDTAPRLAAAGSFTLPDRLRRKGWTEPQHTWLARRADKLVTSVEILLTNHRPDLLAYEYPDYVRAFWSGGSKGRESSVMQAMGRAEGILHGHHPACPECSLVPLVGISTSDAKEGFAGSKAASKARVLSNARLFLPEHDWREDCQDEADAAAVAWVAAVIARRAA